jgi:hypothetical protein
MKKIKLILLLLIMVISGKVFSQKWLSNDTIYINSIPVGVIDNIYKFPVSTFVDITSFNLVENKHIKDVCQTILKVDERFVVSHITEYKDIDVEKYDVSKLGGFALPKKPITHIDGFNPDKIKGIDKPKPVNDDELRQKLTDAGNFYDARNVVFLLGCIGTYGLIKNGDVTTGAVIGGISTITAIILDFCGNQKLKTKKADPTYYWE